MRGGGAGRGLLGGRSHGEMDESEDDDDDDDSSSSSSNSGSEEDEEEEEGKENQPEARRGGRSAKERGDEDVEEREEEANQNGGGEEGEEEMEQEGKESLTLTLQRLSKARMDPTTIVPKLEAAIAPRSAASATHSAARSLIRPPIRTPGPRAEQHPLLADRRPALPPQRSGHTHSRKPRPAHPDGAKRPRPGRPDRPSNGAPPSSASCSSSSQAAPRLPLAALQGGAEVDRDPGVGAPACEREVWVSVFSYLSRADLCVCMAVCKSWHKW